MNMLVRLEDKFTEEDLSQPQGEGVSCKKVVGVNPKALEAMERLNITVSLRL